MSCAPEYTHVPLCPFSTAGRFYLVGRSKDGGRWTVLTLVRGGGSPSAKKEGTELEAHETTSSLSQKECGALLRQIHAGNTNSSGLQLVCKASTACVLTANGVDALLLWPTCRPIVQRSTALA